MVKVVIGVQLRQPYRSSMTEYSEYVVKLDLLTPYLQLYSLPHTLSDH